MAKALTIDTPWTQALATTYTQFTCTQGRNAWINVEGDFFYHPNGADGGAVHATERFKFPEGLYNLRIPGSGSGKDQITGGQTLPLNETGGFSIAAVTGTPDIYVMVVRENVSK